MKGTQRYYKKGHRGGITRLAAILLLLICIMICIIAVPAWEVFEYRSQKTACDQAMKSAGDGLIIEYLGRWDAGSVEEARAVLDEVMPERPNLCPAGGTVYLVRGDHGIFEPVCGLHSSDKRLRARLNASRGLELLQTALKTARQEAAWAAGEKAAAQQSKASDPLGEAAGGADTADATGTLEDDASAGASGEDTATASGTTKENTAGGTSGENAAAGTSKDGSAAEESAGEKDLQIYLNGKKLVCTYVQQEESIRRGTGMTNGYKGIVAFYGIAGEGNFPRCKAEDGEICYFVYADENYCAIYRAGDGWRGSAYE